MRDEYEYRSQGGTDTCKWSGNSPYQPGPDGAFNMKDITFSLPADQQITLEVIYSGMPQVASSARLHMTSGNEITPRFVSLRGNALSPKISVPTDCPVEEKLH